MREVKLFLFDIIDAIDKIRRNVQISKKEFKKNQVLSDFVCYKIIGIGEALKSVSASFQQQYPDIEWKKIIGMRNVITHGYYEVDEDIVFSTINKEFPILRQQILKIIEDNGWLEEFVSSEH